MPPPHQTVQDSIQNYGTYFLASPLNDPQYELVNATRANITNVHNQRV